MSEGREILGGREDGKIVQAKAGVIVVDETPPYEPLANGRPEMRRHPKPKLQTYRSVDVGTCPATDDNGKPVKEFRPMFVHPGLLDSGLVK